MNPYLTFKDNDLRTTEFLIQSSLQELYLRWAAIQPLRSGLHASSLLVPPGEWCTRRFVLAEIAPEEAQAEQLHYWDWLNQSRFLDGWERHRKWQKLFMHFANVVWGSANSPGETAPELDLTHHDETRNVFFSPDAIIDYAGVRYVVEIKGINHDEYTGHDEMYKRTFAKPGSVWTFNYDKVQEAKKGIKDCTLEEAMKLSQPVYKAFYQAQLYMHLLELQYAIILVENKNTQEFKVWVIQYDSEATLPYVQRAYDVKGRVALFKRSRQLPERVCKSSDDRLACKCPMRDCCFSSKREE